MSIGSLYQYFPNKEAIVKAVLERHLERCEVVLQTELEKTRSASLAKIVESTVRVMFEFYSAHEDLSDVFHHQLPKEGAYRALSEHQSRCAKIIEMYMTAHTDQVRARDLRLAPSIIVHAVTGAIIGTEKNLKADRANFLREIQDMAAAYLLSRRD